MDHIASYFSKVIKQLGIKNQEKEIFISLIKEKTGINIKSKDFIIKNNIIKLKIFGPRRSKILSQKDSILQDLKNKSVITDLQ